MNESIRHRELKMTVICKSCENQYGAWRPRCPTCGTSTPVKVQEARIKREVARRAICVSECAFCRQRGAKHRCPVCNELVHNTCLGLHRPECEQFQRDCAAEQLRLSSGGPSLQTKEKS